MEQNSVRWQPIAPSAPTGSPPSERSSRPTPLPPLSKPAAEVRPLRVLGIDIENGPDWYGPGEYVYQRIFCIASKWVGSPEGETRSFLLDWRKPDRSLVATLKPLWEEIASADVFLGHNFRHDWGGLNGLARRLDLALPERRRIIDTMRCVPSGGVPRSLEYLCAQFDLGEKPHLTAIEWTDALHRWRGDALTKVRFRNEMDVILTERLYRKERDLGWL